MRGDVVSALVVLGAGFLFARLWGRARRIPAGPFEDLVISGGLFAIVVGRLVWVGTEAPLLYRHPFDLIRVQSGVDYSSAAVTFALVSWVQSRRGGVELRDFAAVTLLFAMAGFAVLCLLRGDCYGQSGPYPIAIPFAQFSEPRLPIGLYEAIGLTSVGFILLSARLSAGALLCASLAAFALVQFGVEFGRVGAISRFTYEWRWGWLLLAVGSLTVMSVVQRLQTRTGVEMWRDLDQLYTTDSSSTLTGRSADGGKDGTGDPEG